MHLEVNVLHHDYPSRVREMVEHKLEPLRKFYRRTVSMRAVLQRQHEEHRVEIVANVGHGTVLVADAREDAFTAALDEAAERMGRLLRRHNEKRTHGRRRAHKG